MWPRQTEVVHTTLHPDAPDAVVANLRTASGKTHVMRVLGSMQRGFVPIFIPLLTLSADVLDKFKSANQRFGKVLVFHLDELAQNEPAKHEAFIELCHTQEAGTRHTFFVFLSPQHLIKYPRARAALLMAAEKGTLKTVIMDEVHVHIQHGTSFREECRALTSLFFRPLFHPEDRVSKVVFLATTATLPHDYICELARLTTLRFPPASIIRGTLEEFLQIEIRMRQVLVSRGGYVNKGLQQAADFLKDNDESKVAIFCNSKAKSFHYLSEFELKLDASGVKPDVIHIHGDLDKHEKFWRIRLFCGTIDDEVDGVNIRALLATNAANVGIDDDRLDWNARFEFVRDLCTYTQERGRGSRERGRQSTFTFFFDLQSFEYLYRQYLLGDDDDDDDVSDLQLEFRQTTAASSPTAKKAKQVERP